MTSGLPIAEILSLHPLAPIAWAAASSAARFLMDERPELLVVESKSTPTDAVTEMDRGAEARIIASILESRPNDGVLGEEGGERRGTSGVRWVIDPLDGTVNYTYRLPSWGVSVAAEVEGRSAVGVVMTPMLGEAAVGIRGQGSWLVARDLCVPLHAGTCTELPQALVATGFGYHRETRIRQGEVTASLLGSIRDIRRSGSAVVDFVGLASGRLDGYFESGLHEWDIAAGALIAQEAGAIVRSLTGDDPNTGVMVGASPGIAQQLLDTLRALDAV